MLLTYLLFAKCDQRYYIQLFFSAATPPSPTFFVATNCSDSSYIGSSCNISMKPCNAMKPCQNSGTCTNDVQFPDGYYCECPPDFTGKICESNVGPCKLNTCLHNGISTIFERASVHILIYFRHLHTIERYKLSLQLYK
jgi:hypothetical protein